MTSNISSLNISLLALVCMSCGIFLGGCLRWMLPGHHLRDESKELLKTASGMIATLVALVIGLLVSSAKSSFDQANAGLIQGGAKIVTLDRYLIRYGAETKEIRGILRKSVETMIERIWPAGGTRKADLPAIEAGMTWDLLFERIRALEPRDSAQKYDQGQALQLCSDLLLMRWLLIEQTQNSLPPVFLIILVLWLTVLFVGFGMLAPWNMTSICSLVVCAASMSCALFLIMELNRPHEGIIQIPRGPLQKVVEILER